MKYRTDMINGWRHYNNTKQIKSYVEIMLLCAINSYRSILFLGGHTSFLRHLSTLPRNLGVCKLLANVCPSIYWSIFYEN